MYANAQVFFANLRNWYCWNVYSSHARVAGGIDSFMRCWQRAMLFRRWVRLNLSC